MKNKVRKIIGIVLATIGVALTIRAGIDMVKELTEEVNNLLGDNNEAKDNENDKIINIKP